MFNLIDKTVVTKTLKALNTIYEKHKKFTYDQYNNCETNLIALAKEQKKALGEIKTVDIILIDI